MISTDPANVKRWRVCHNYAYSNFYGASGQNGGSANFGDGVNTSVSRDGHYMLFSSTWGNTMGGVSGSPPTGQYYPESFVVEML